MPASLRPGRTPVFVLATIVGAAPFAGCSFIFSEGPPPQHRELRHFACSSSYVPPVLDTIWAGLGEWGAARTLATPDAEWTAANDRSQTLGVGLAWLAVSGAAAYYGYSRANQCTEAKRELTVRLQRWPGPATWPAERQPGYYLPAPPQDPPPPRKSRAPGPPPAPAPSAPGPPDQPTPPPERKISLGMRPSPG